jgi:hypothetical protein
MDQIGFRGYAQSLGFDPIKAPDESKRELQRGQQEIDNVRRTQASNRKNREEFADALSRKNQIESQNRLQNFNSEKEWRRAFQNQVLANQERQLRNFAVEQDNIARNYEALGQFSETATKIALDYRKKREEAEDIEGQNFIVDNGVSAEQFFKWRQQVDQVDQADTAFNAVANNAPNAELRARVRALSGRRLYGAMKQLAIQGGLEYETFLLENADKPIEINGEQITLNDAKNRGPEVFRAAMVMYRSQYLKFFRGINPELANQYLYEGIRRTEAAHLSGYTEARSKALNAQEKEENYRQLILEMNPENGDGPEAFVNWYMRQSGGDKAMIGVKRREGLALLKQAIAAGQFSEDQLQALEEYPISLGGAEPQPFGKLYAAELVELREEFRRINMQRRQDEEIATDELRDQYKEKFLEGERSLGRPYNEKELQAWAAKYEEDLKEPAPEWLKGRMSQEQLSTQLGNEEAQYLANRGLLTTDTLINSGRFTEQTIARFRNQAVDGDSFNSISKSTRKNNNDAIEQALKEVLGSVGLGENQNPGFYMALESAQRDYNQKVLSQIKEGITPDQAANNATKAIVEEIRNGVKGIGRYALKGDFINGKYQLRLNAGQRGFKLESSDNTDFSESKRYNNIIAQIRTNPRALSTVKLLREEEIKQIQAFGKGQGTIPPIVVAIANRLKKKSVFDVMNDQLKAYDINETIAIKPEAALFDIVSPEVRTMLTWRPSRARTVAAAQRTGGNAYQPLLDLIASEESISTDPGNNGYDAFNLEGRAGGTVAIGSNNVFNGRKVSQMTIGEIMDLHRNGAIHAVGRYQFIGDTLKWLVDKGVAKPTELFSKAVQDRLAISQIHHRAGRFLKNGTDLNSAVVGIGREWIGVRDKVPRAKVIAALEQTRAALQGAGADTSNWRSGIVYKIGGIGPTSTGPHLHAHLDGYGYFDRNFLDRYFEVNHNGKWVPPSAGVTVEGGKFGAFRSGRPEGHRAWDYAFPDGAKVRAKNGVRPLGKGKMTEHGLKRRFALPDGRVVVFLHGHQHP